MVQDSISVKDIAVMIIIAAIVKTVGANLVFEEIALLNFGVLFD